MIRTIVSLPEEDKRWLDMKAAEDGVPMTEIIRRAVRLLRAQEPGAARDTEDLLAATAGTWRQEDGLEVQERLRDEW